MNLAEHIGAIQSTSMPQQGMTSTVTLIDTARGRFALKRATRPPFTVWLRREAAMLRALADRSLPVPCLITLEDQMDEVSLLMTALPGEPLNALLCRGASDEVRRELLTQFGQMLRTIHCVAPPATLRAEHPWLERILEEARYNLERGYAELDAPPVADVVATCPPAIPEVLIHGDYTLDNILVHEGRISGVIDWGRGDVGDPRYDLALATRPQTPERAFLEEADFAAFYRGYAAAPLSSAEGDWFYTLYAYF